MGKLLLYNALDMSFEFVRLRKNPNCRVCGPNPSVTTLIDYEAFCGAASNGRPSGSVGGCWDISAGELAGRLQSGDPLCLLDVREPHELQISQIEGARLIPLGQLATRLAELDSAEEIVVFCKTGIRSARALELMLGAGFRNIKNLQGGVNAWAREVRFHPAGVLENYWFPPKCQFPEERLQYKNRTRCHFDHHFSAGTIAWTLNFIISI